MSIILIDGSYYMFYRYYAILSWWKRAHPDEPIDDPITCKAFVSTFRSTFLKNIEKFKKTHQLNDTNSKIIIAKDCHQKDIWRQNHTTEYKTNRDYSNFKGGPFFKMAYDELFQASGGKIVSHPHLEADDCIACLVNQYKSFHENIYILANDHDYMQLIDSNVHVYNLQGKSLREHKAFYGSAEKALFMKIILGDKSDNIPPVFSKCGAKTAEKYYENNTIFLKKLESDSDARTRLETNRMLIDFSNIPKKYHIEFISKHYYICPKYWSFKL